MLSLDTSKLKVPITDIQAQIMLREAYDRDYGLNTGLFNVGICEEEMLVKGSLTEYWAKQYKQCRIWETWHINLNEFMQKPRYEMDMLCDLAFKEDMKALTEDSETRNLLHQKGLGLNLDI